MRATLDRVSSDRFSVADLCHAVSGAVEAAFPDEVWVSGTITGLTRSSSGHVYFDLIDDPDMGRSPDALLPVTLFNTARQRVNMLLRKTGAGRIEDGTEVLIRGTVSYYAPQGRVQLRMSLIDPSYTIGRVEAARLELLARLRNEGLLRRNAQLDIPLAPLRIGLIASAGSAAEADFRRHLEASPFAFEVADFDTRVQGPDAVDDLVAALAAATELAGLDVIAIVRGGGARTDLAVFDHERLARTIALTDLPVLVGIGHETDHTVADDVAALSARTPTGCAQLIIDRVSDFDSFLSTTLSRVAQQATTRVLEADAALATATRRLSRVSSRVDREQHQLGLVTMRVRSSIERELARRTHQLDTAETKVDLLDPRHALGRGWAIVRDSEGRLIRSVSAVRSRQDLTVTVADGDIRTRVTGQGTMPGNRPSDPPGAANEDSPLDE